MANIVLRLHLNTQAAIQHTEKEQGSQKFFSQNCTDIVDNGISCNYGWRNVKAFIDIFTWTEFKPQMKALTYRQKNCK